MLPSQSQHLHLPLLLILCICIFIILSKNDLGSVKNCSDIKGIMSALQQIKEKTKKDGQKKNEETISR